MWMSTSRCHGFLALRLEDLHSPLPLKSGHGSKIQEPTCEHWMHGGRLLLHHWSGREAWVDIQRVVELCLARWRGKKKSSQCSGVKVFSLKEGEEVWTAKPELKNFFGFWEQQLKIKWAGIILVLASTETQPEFVLSKCHGCTKFHWKFAKSRKWQSSKCHVLYVCLCGWCVSVSLQKVLPPSRVVVTSAGCLFNHATTLWGQSHPIFAVSKKFHPLYLTTVLQGKYSGTPLNNVNKKKKGLKVRGLFTGSTTNQLTEYCKEVYSRHS